LRAASESGKLAVEVDGLGATSGRWLVGAHRYRDQEVDQSQCSDSLCLLTGQQEVSRWVVVDVVAEVMTARRGDNLAQPAPRVLRLGH